MASKLSNGGHQKEGRIGEESVMGGGATRLGLGSHASFLKTAPTPPSTARSPLSLVSSSSLPSSPLLSLQSPLVHLCSPYLSSPYPIFFGYPSL